MLQFEYLRTLGNQYCSLDYLEASITACLAVAQTCSTVGVTWMWFPTDGNLPLTRG